MPKIFLSYRRSQAAAHTGRIHDRLRRHFADDDFFVDVNSIPLGIDFREYITSNVRQCRVLLAVIGPNWLGKSGTRRRIDDPTDFVRLEIEIALECRIPVIPILIDGARMPPEAVLPPSLARLAYSSAINVDQGPDFDHQVDRLFKGIERLLQTHEPDKHAHESERLKSSSPLIKERRPGRSPRHSEQLIARSTRRRDTLKRVFSSGSSSNRSLTGNVLIVDGDEGFREAHRELLSSAFPDLAVATAPDSNEAIKSTSSGNLDLIVVDLWSGGNYEAGYETLLDLKNANPGIEVIAFTSYPKYQTAVRCIRAGCLDYIDKANGAEALLEGVKRAIELARSGARRRMLVEQLILADWEMMQLCQNKKSKAGFWRI
jgi:CheY-like chemotaxis protein